MAYNQKFFKTDSATARCLAGTGAERSYTATAESIISQRDVDRKALGWAKAAAQSMLVCTIGGAGAMSVSPSDGFTAAVYALPATCAVAPKTYVITNTGTAALSWAAALADSSAFSISQASGTLEAGESASVVVSYLGTEPVVDTSTTLTFTNLTNAAGNTTRSMAVVAATTPSVAESYTMFARNATVVGWEEFTDATVPPRFYRVRSATGEIIAQYFDEALCGGNVTASIGLKFSGASTMDDNEVVTAGVNQYNGSASGSGSITWDSPTVVELMNIAGIATDCTALTTLRVSRSLASNEACDTCFTFPEPQKVSTCTLEETLSSEDTDAAAWARAPIVETTDTVGTASTQLVRTYQTFGQTTCQYTLTVSDTVAGGTYKVILSIYTTPIGGGDTVESFIQTVFTAAGSSHVVSGTLTAAEGYEIVTNGAFMWCPEETYPPVGPGPGP